MAYSSAPSIGSHLPRTSTEAGSSRSSSSQHRQLLKLLRRNPDIKLVFDDRELPGHSQVLGLWSHLLQDVVTMLSRCDHEGGSMLQQGNTHSTTECSSGKTCSSSSSRDRGNPSSGARDSGGSGSGSDVGGSSSLTDSDSRHKYRIAFTSCCPAPPGRPPAAGSGTSPSQVAGTGAAAARPSSLLATLPMPGTSSSDWLKVMAFAYPSAEPAVVGWDNLEALLVCADRYDMPVLLDKAGAFLVAHARDFGLAAGELLKWLGLADRAGLKAAAEACAAVLARRHRGSCCSRENLAGLSRGALQCLVGALALAPAPLSAVSGSSSSSSSWAHLAAAGQHEQVVQGRSAYYYHPAPWR